MSFFLVGFLVSSLGFVLLSYGRKLQRPPQLVAGLILLVLPYLVPTILWMLGGTVAVLLLLWTVLNRDW